MYPPLRIYKPSDLRGDTLGVNHPRIVRHIFEIASDQRRISLLDPIKSNELFASML